MSFLNFLIALSPIIVVLVGILAFHQSAKKVAPVALVWTLILAFTYFNVTGATFKENVATYDPLVWKGLKEGLKKGREEGREEVAKNLLSLGLSIDVVKKATNLPQAVIEKLTQVLPSSPTTKFSTTA